MKPMNLDELSPYEGPARALGCYTMYLKHKAWCEGRDAAAKDLTQSIDYYDGVHNKLESPYDVTVSPFDGGPMLDKFQWPKHFPKKDHSNGR
jgi:hypothetical protein